MNTVGYFEIQADDPTRAAAFYAAVFDWEFVRDVAVVIPYWQIKQAGPNGGLLQRPAPRPASGQGTNAYVVSVQVEDFDTIASKVLENKGIVALDKFAIPGRCWQGYFMDTEGNTFGIFQVDENAK